MAAGMEIRDYLEQLANYESWRDKLIHKFASTEDGMSALDVTDAPPAGERVVIVDLQISTDTRGELRLQDENGVQCGGVFITENFPWRPPVEGSWRPVGVDRKLQVVGVWSCKLRAMCTYFTEQVVEEP